MKPVFAILLAIATGLIGGAIGFFAGANTGALFGSVGGMMYGGCKTVEAAEKDGLLKPEQSKKVLQDATKLVSTDLGLNESQIPKEIDCQKIVADMKSSKTQK